MAGCINPVQVGSEFKKTPPHITILPPCSIGDKNLNKFINGIARVAEDWLPIVGLTSYPVLFGKDNDIQVMPVDFIEPGIFCGTIILADKMGLDYDRTYAVNYVKNESEDLLICKRINQPHITEFEGFKPMEYIKINQIQLFCLSAIKKVVATFDSKGFIYEK